MQKIKEMRNHTLYINLQNFSGTRLLLCAFFCVFATMVQAQVTVEAKLDSAGILVGKRMGITLEVSADAGKFVELPQFDSLQQIVPGLEFVNATPVDTDYVNDGKRMVLTEKYYVTSFDTSLYSIPPMGVKVEGKVYKSNSLGMKVITYDIDTLNVDSIFGLKSEMAPPFVWADWSLVFRLSILAVIIALVLIYVAVRLKDNKPIIKRIKLKKRVAPHKAAMQKIEEIKEDKMLWQSEDSKEYYTQLTDTLRNYIKERYGFNAMEMTSFEIIQHLQEVNDEEAIGELRELFQTADLVKFAKYNTLINENDRNLVTAIEYINQTKQEEEEQKAQPEEIVVVEPHSKMTKRLLIAGVSVAAIVLVGVIGFLCYRIYMLTL